MRKRFKDWISLIEAGYNLEGSDDIWVNGLLEKAAPLANRGIWPTIATYRYTATQVDIEHVATTGPGKLEGWCRSTTSEHPKAVDLMYRSSVAVGSLSEVVFSQLPDLRHAVRKKSMGAMSDVLGIKAHTGTGRGLVLFTGFIRSTFASTEERKRWPLVISHLAAGLRLRQVARNLRLDANAVEAILDSSGRVQHIKNSANDCSARDQLRLAASTIDRIRNNKHARQDPERTLPLWQGLVSGRWSLVDRFDTDGKRFIVALKNDPIHSDPRGLTDKERQVAEYIGIGYSNKRIAYMFGISEAAVSNCATRIMVKLGLPSRVELASFFSPTGLRAQLADISLAGEELLLGSYPLAGLTSVDKLTDAELSVLSHLVAGSTNQDIADRRDASVRTVANQIQSIYRKMNVRSRAELAASLQCSASAYGR